MNRVFVNITLYSGDVPNFEELLPKEQAAANEWKEEGILEHLFNRNDKNGVILVLKDVDEVKAKLLVDTLPLAPYFRATEFIVTEQQF